MKKLISLGILLLATLFFYGLGYLYPEWLTTYYTQGVNKFYIEFLSLFSGIFPFSLFEIGIYLLLLLALSYLVYRIYHLFISPTSWKKQLIASLIHTFYLCFTLFMIFLWSWGFNYNRTSLADTLMLPVNTYSTSDLANLYSTLIHSANTLREEVKENELGYMTIPGGYKDVFSRTEAGYKALAKVYPFFEGHYGRPKALLVSPWMNYTGITGIYAPFTGEPNVNVAILDQALPYTTLHEMAHQRGFASEDECNFIAFLASSMHPDKDFQYSGYLLALSYTNSALAESDPLLLQTLNQQISSKVRADLNSSNTFWSKYEGPVQEVSSQINNTYLKANGVTEGEKSYGHVVDLLLAYQKKYPNAL